VRSLRKSISALLVFIPVFVWVGCQKGGDSSQPAAAVAVSDAAKTQGATVAAASAASEVAPGKSEQDLLHPSYEVETNQGKFVVRLDAEKAPLTVDNFRNYAARGHYDLTIFHQVFKGSVQIVLGGGYTADLKEKASRTPIRNEAHNGLKNRRGTIAMARRPDDEDSATCQFFINVADNSSLDFKARSHEGYGYCVFGEVTEGMDVIDRIAKTPVHDTEKFIALPVETVVIKSVRQVK
jgi:cyclophilin family peptidyl-prolyl cis-trans isomerase